ncbi:hypothetical protein [Methylibium petroleiphilum]|uniref:hypothetical protein n=1 Tax=Methylibium petroleiphilum TaxID=105560 RepID=UPI001ACE4E69|nr:hypothetical protein [Methylibium petroleiphilum]MBN9206010.1 hypothetical protein [Methylibium petroleiphilum]
MPSPVSVAQLAMRLHATEQPVLRLDLEAEIDATDERPARGYVLESKAIVFESLAERNRHVAEFVYADLAERLVDTPSLLYQRGHELWCNEIGHDDQASGRLMAMAARHLDVLALGSQEIRRGTNVFDALHLLEAALPYIEELNLASMIELCEAKYEATKNDLAGGAIHASIESWLANKPARAKELHGVVVGRLSDASASLLSNAVVALARTDFAGAFSLAKADATDASSLRARVGTWTLGRLLLEEAAPADMRADVAASVSGLIEKTTGDLRAQAIRAATGAMHRSASFDVLLKRLAQEGDQDVLAGVATALFLKAGEMLARGDLQEWLGFMTKLTPQLKGAVAELDRAMSRLLAQPANAPLVVATLTQWAAQHGSRMAIDRLVAESFDATVNKLSAMDPAWSALVTDWLLSDQPQHAASLAGMLTSLPHRETSLRLAKGRLDTLESGELLFLARRMLGYVHDRAFVTSLALSMLDSDDARTRIFPVLRALLVDEIGYDYPGSTVTACKAAAGTCAVEGTKEFLDGIADAIEQTCQAFDQLPRLNELRPPTSLRRQFALARARQMSDSVEAAQKDSIWRQIATEIPVKAGRGTFSYRNAAYGAPMKMSSFSHSIEVPRREVFDPIGNSIRLLQFRLAKKDEA